MYLRRSEDWDFLMDEEKLFLTFFQPFWRRFWKISIEGQLN